MMLRIIATCALMAASMFGQELTGSWLGSINLGQKILRIGLRIEQSALGFSGTLHNIDEGTICLLSSINAEKTSVHIGAKAIQATFDGEQDGMEMKGQYQQGGGAITTLTFRRVALLPSFQVKRYYEEAVSDPAFATQVPRPAYVRKHPAVLVDSQLTQATRFGSFFELLRSDGYHVIEHKGEYRRRGDLDNADLVVVRRYGAPTIRASAYSGSECTALRDWVLDGGALLLTIDHFPFDFQGEALANSFGVKVSKGVIGDGGNYDRTAANPRVGLPLPGEGPDAIEDLILFTRDNGLLQDHPITRGRNNDEQLRRVAVFGGSSITGPPGATEFLKLSATATNRNRDGQEPIGMGTAQGVAFNFGKGRVVVLGDGTMLSAQIVYSPRRPPFLLGMARLDFDNRQLALNIMHWLSGLLVE